MEYDVKVAFEAHSLKVRFESDYSNSYLAKNTKIIKSTYI